MKREIKVVESNEGYKVVIYYDNSIYHTIEGELVEVQEQLKEDLSELVMEAYTNGDSETNIIFTIE